MLDTRGSAFEQAGSELLEDRAALLVCHEDPLIASGLAREAERAVPMAIDIAAGIGEATASVGARRFDLIVLSDGLSSEAGLAETARRLRQAGAGAPLLVIARAESVGSFEDALAAGAIGYLPIGSAHAKLAATVQALLSGRSVLSFGDSGALDLPRLTRREHDVLVASDRGLSHKQIAHELGIAVSTVKTHSRSVYSKLDAVSRTDALHKARKVGLLA